MEYNAILILIAGAACGGFVNGMAGFGTGLFALGFWLQIMPPVQAVAISVVVASITGLQGLWVVRSAILDQPRRLLRFLLPALVGIPLGASALVYVEPHALKLLIASFMILYGLFFLARRALPKFESPTPLTDNIIGFVSGILGGLAGLSGALPVMWCTLRPWSRHATRAVLQPFNLTVLALTALYLAWQGTYTAETLRALGIALLASLSFAQLGLFVFHRISDTQFRWLLIGLMFCSGAILMLRELT